MNISADDDELRAALLGWLGLGVLRAFEPCWEELLFRFVAAADSARRVLGGAYEGVGRKREVRRPSSHGPLVAAVVVGECCLVPKQLVPHFPNVIGGRFTRRGYESSGTCCSGKPGIQSRVS